MPAATQVIGTLTAVDTFLGAILSLSSKNYVQATDGRLLVDKTSPIKDSYSLELTTPLDKLDSMSHVTVEVQTKTLGSLTTPKTKNGDNSD